MSRFYLSKYGSCRVCQKPATQEIRGPYTIQYAYACEKHAKQILASLEDAHKETTEFPTQ